MQNEIEAKVLQIDMVAKILEGVEVVIVADMVKILGSGCFFNK